MAEHLVVEMLVGIALFAGSSWRTQRPDRRAIRILMWFAVPILYLGVMFAFNRDWVNLHDLANMSIGKLAESIVGWLEHQPR